MSIISRRMRWLELLFPPGQAAPPNPSEVSDDIVLVHQVLTGTERLTQFQEFNVTGGAGSNTATGPAVPADKWWYVFAAGVFHNDPLPVEMALHMRSDITALEVCVIAAERAVPTFARLGAPRPIILPPRCNLFGRTIGIAGAQQVTVRGIFIEMDLGEPAPSG